MTAKFHNSNSVQDSIISGWYIILFRIVSGQAIITPTFTSYSTSAKLVDDTTTPISHDSVTATITAQPQGITLIFTRNKTADTTIHYQDTTG